MPPSEQTSGAASRCSTVFALLRQGMLTLLPQNQREIFGNFDEKD